MEIESVRLVSLTQRAIAAIRYRVRPVNEKLRLVVMSEIVANEEVPVASADPRAAAILQKPLVGEERSVSGRMSISYLTAAACLKIRPRRKAIDRFRARACQWRVPSLAFSIRTLIVMWVCGIE